MRRKRYQGHYGDLAGLVAGDYLEITKPSELTPAAFRRVVTNAVAHLCRTRDRKLRTKVAASGSIMVWRVHTEAELDDMGF